MKHYADEGYATRFGNLSTIYDAKYFVSQKLKAIFGLEVSSSVQYFTSTADQCKNQEGGTLNSTCRYAGTENDHLTEAALLANVGYGTPTLTKYAWTGHIIPDSDNDPRGAVSGSYSSAGVVVMLPRHFLTSNLSNASASVIKNRSYCTLLHETSHQLGAPDHYCYGNENDDICSNDQCDIHAYNRSSIRKCIMGEAVPPYNDKMESINNIDMYCYDCVWAICAHIRNHH